MYGGQRGGQCFVKAAVFRGARLLKDSFLHLPVFLLIFAVVLIITTCFSLLAGWSEIHNPAFPREPGWLGKQLQVTVGNVMPVSVIAALFVLFFRIQKKPRAQRGNRLLSFILPLAAGFIVVIAVTSLIFGPAGSPLPKNYTVLYPFAPETIHQTDSGLIYTGGVDGTRESGDGIRLDNVIRYADGKLQYDRAAAVAVRSANGEKTVTIVSSTTSKQPVAVTPPNPLYSQVFEPPGIIASMATDVTALNGYLAGERTRSTGGSALAVFSLLLLVMGCIIFSRITRSIMFNMVVSIVVFRGVFLILRFLESDIGRELGEMMSIESIPIMLPTLTFLALGVVLTAINLIFPGKRNG